MAVVAFAGVTLLMEYCRSCSDIIEMPWDLTTRFVARHLIIGWYGRRTVREEGHGLVLEHRIDEVNMSSGLAAGFFFPGAGDRTFCRGLITHALFS